MSVVERTVTFDCQGDRLLGVLHAPDAGRGAGSPRPLAVLVVVGGPQYRVGSHRQFVRMARRLADSGYPTLRFDYRGMGDSDGEPRTFEDCGADIDAAVAELSHQCPGHDLMLLGLCDAASAILMYLERAESVAGVVLMNPWARSEATLARTYAEHYYRGRFLSADFWRKLLTGRVPVVRAAREYLGNRARGRAGSVADSQGFLERMLSGFDRRPWPALVILSGEDLTAREFEEMCAGDPRWQRRLAHPDCTPVAIAGADHTFSDPEHLDACLDSIVDWLDARRRA